MTTDTSPTLEAAREMGKIGSPTIEAERIAFEAWIDGHSWTLGHVFWDGTGYTTASEQKTRSCGFWDYHAMHIRGMWAAWRDRAALARIALTAALRDLDEARAENDTLRGLLANSGKPCAHCGLPVEKWAECPHGFPGCARADDATLIDLFTTVEHRVRQSKGEP